jgi:hypothetical protein
MGMDMAACISCAVWSCAWAVEQKLDGSRIKSENARARIDAAAGLGRENTADREVITILNSEYGLDSLAENWLDV